MKVRCCGGEMHGDGTWTMYLEVPPGTHIRIDDEWNIERTADQPSRAIIQQAKECGCGICDACIAASQPDVVQMWRDKASAVRTELMLKPDKLADQQAACTRNEAALVQPTRTFCVKWQCYAPVTGCQCLPCILARDGAPDKSSGDVL
jgi:hypothetical protein